MMKGYLTVFLALSVSIFSGFILFLTGNAVKNAGKIRLEGAVDIGMNSVLAEYHIGLKERYDLFYIDASYNHCQPSTANLESRLDFYIMKNVYHDNKNTPWGNILFQKAEVKSIQTAADGKGNSMKNQAVTYIRDSKTERPEARVSSFLPEIKKLDQRDAAAEWSALQEQIAGMELPRILNEQGEWEEVPLGNPADHIFHLLCSDILYLAEANLKKTGIGCIQKKDYISARKIQENPDYRYTETEEEDFLVYLHEKMGSFRNPKQDGFLQLQLEYIAAGKESDYENLKEAAETLLRWRFSSDIELVMADAGLYREARAMAEALLAVQLKEAFKEPVTKSILYACAYLEAIKDVKSILRGDRIPIRKDRCYTPVTDVADGNIGGNNVSDGTGLNYEQYISCMLTLADRNKRDFRSMDIIEMDIRFLTGNPYFKMDWCIERCSAVITAKGSLKDKYTLNRMYGYY